CCAGQRGKRAAETDRRSNSANRHAETTGLRGSSKLRYLQTEVKEKVMRIRFLITVIGMIALTSSVFGQSGDGFTLSPSKASGGGNTTANGPFSLTGTIGQSTLGTIGKKNLSIIGGIFGPKVQPFIYGDVNNNHIVNINDLLAMANFLAGNT